MTALATIFALIPMGLGLTGGGVFISKPLAIVVIGGLTLLLVPVLDLLEGGSAPRAARRAAPAPPSPTRATACATRRMTTRAPSRRGSRPQEPTTPGLGGLGATKLS